MFPHVAIVFYLNAILSLVVMETTGLPSPLQGLILRTIFIEISFFIANI